MAPLGFLLRAKMGDASGARAGEFAAVRSKRELGGRPETPGSAALRRPFAAPSPERRPVNPWPYPAEPASSGCGHTFVIAPAHGPTAASGTPAAPPSIARSASGCVAVRLPTASPHDDFALPRRPAPPRDLPRHGRGRRPQRLGDALLGRAGLPGMPSLRDPGPRIRSDPLRLVWARAAPPVQLQGARCLSLVQHPPDGRGRGAPDRSGSPLAPGPGAPLA